MRLFAKKLCSTPSDVMESLHDDIRVGTSPPSDELVNATAAGASEDVHIDDHQALLNLVREGMAGADDSVQVNDGGSEDTFDIIKFRRRVEQLT